MYSPAQKEQYKRARQQMPAGEDALEGLDGKKETVNHKDIDMIEGTAGKPQDEGHLMMQREGSAPQLIPAELNELPPDERAKKIEEMGFKIVETTPS